MCNRRLCLSPCGRVLSSSSSSSSSTSSSSSPPFLCLALVVAAMSTSFLRVAPPQEAAPAVAAGEDLAMNPGLKRYETAPPKAKAKRWVCHEVVRPGEFRLTYRFRKSTSLRHESYMHGTAECIRRLPATTRVADLAFLRRQCKPGLPVQVREFLDAMLAALGPGEPASGSGGPLPLPLWSSRGTARPARDPR